MLDSIAAPELELLQQASPPITADQGAEQRVEETLDRLQQASDELARTERLSLSVVIPAYNEEQTISKLVQRVLAVGRHDEIIIVDDASTDGTRHVLRELEQTPGIRVLLHDVNRGKGAAIRTALAAAQSDVILIQDADLEYDPVDYPRLMAPIERGEADVVYGSRFLRNAEQDPSLLHRCGNRLLTTASNIFTGQRLTDMETCYKVFRRDLITGMRLRQDRFGFEPELTAKLSRRGARIKEVPIRYQSRGYEEGKKIGLRDGFNAVYCILRFACCD